MADDTPKLTDDDLALWQQVTDGVAPVASSKKPPAKTPPEKTNIDTTVEDFSTEPNLLPTPLPADIDQFENYLNGHTTTPSPPPPATPAEQPLAAKPPLPAPQNPFTVLQHSAELIVGSRGGVDSRLLKKLSTGEIKPTRRLDLHGHYLLDAYQAVRHFLEESQNQGHKCVLIIHGKGGGHAQEMGVIKQNISHFLADIPQILAFHTATRRHGGSGACYVLLKRKK